MVKNINVKITPMGNKPMEELLTRAVEAVFNDFALDFAAQADISLVEAAEIQQINREYRDIDRVTDVLSFPMLIFHEGQLLEDALPDPETGNVFLGDIILCLPRATEQAAEYGHSVERECAYLAVHSMLHLLGFDHEDEDEEKAIMRQREEKIMDKLNLGRDASWNK